MRRRIKPWMILLIAGVFFVGGFLTYYAVKDANKKNRDYGEIREIHADQNLLLDPDVTEGDGELLRVVMFDCGDALCVLVDMGATEIMYDAGYRENGKANAEKAEEFIDGKLDYLIISHSHADHSGGVPDITAKYEVGTIITSGEGDGGSSYQWEAACKAIEKEGCKVLDDANMSFELDHGAMLTIHENLDPGETANANDLSVIVTVTYKDTVVLFTGDAEKEAEKNLKGRFKDVTLYIAGHHLSSTSNMAALLKEWSPECIIASCAGKNSEYGFPHKAAVRRCLKETQNIYATFKSGDIVFASNGKEWAVDCEDIERLQIEDCK